MATEVDFSRDRKWSLEDKEVRTQDQSGKIYEPRFPGYYSRSLYTRIKDFLKRAVR